jgi:hypothetical protein
MMLMAIVPAFDLNFAIAPSFVMEFVSMPQSIYIVAAKGSGKSSMVTMFSDLGYYVIDSDDYGKWLTLIAGKDVSEINNALDTFGRMSLSDRESLKSVFDLYAEQIVCEAGELFLRRFDSLMARMLGFYNSMLAAYPPFVLYQRYLLLAQESSFQDSVGHTIIGEERVVMFFHTYVDAFVQGGALTIYLESVGDNLATIQLRGRGVFRAEMLLFMVYESINYAPGSRLSFGIIRWMLDNKEFFVPSEDAQTDS